MYIKLYIGYQHVIHYLHSIALTNNINIINQYFVYINPINIIVIIIYQISSTILYKVTSKIAIRHYQNN